MHGARCAAFRLHLLDDRHVAPDVLDSLGGPRVGELGHRRRWRDREDRRDLVDAVGDVRGRRVAIHDGALDAGHAFAPVWCHPRTANLPGISNGATPPVAAAAAGSATISMAWH